MQLTGSTLETRVYAEAVSTAFLDGASRLSARQEELLVELGWHPPDDPDSNYSREWNRASDAARLVVFTNTMGDARDSVRRDGGSA